MKTERNILIAFILNLAFSIFEFVGGAITGSVAILSDAVHDIGDAASIGLSYFLEKRSKKEPDDRYTYGYRRLSVLASLITTVILLFGSASVMYNAIIRIFNPVEINYKGMIVFAIIGVIVNLFAAIYTKDGHSLNQKAVNLHMLEDVLGWIVVLFGAIILNYTNLIIIDPIISIGVSLFIFINAIKNLQSIENIFMEKLPSGIFMDDIKNIVSQVDGVADAHHIHIWSIDGYNNCATMHIVTDTDGAKVKASIREVLKGYNIVHCTLELEHTNENCNNVHCHTEYSDGCKCHHNHH